MSLWIQAGATGVPLAASVAAAVYYRRSAKQHERRMTRATRERDAGAAELEAVAVALGRLADEIIPGVAARTVPATRMRFPGLVPIPLEGTALAERLTAVAQGLGYAVEQVRAEEAESASARVAEAHAAAQEATRAVVRGVASSMVAVASRLNRQVSTAVREHADDEVYASLMAIDRQSQQLLLAAQSYLILSGGKLSRRWPDSTLTDVVRAAMGYLDGFERIVHEECRVAVTARAVGPVIHALALLLDNALRYSPPTARVEVRLNEGYHGVTVTIDDAGICMSPEQLKEGRDVLAAAQEVDIALEAQPRVGFRVVAALGKAYGFQADVQAPNSQHGTRALLFLPKAILTTSEDVSAGSVSEASGPAVTTENGLTVRRPRRPAGHGATAEAGWDERESVRPGRASVAAAWAQGIGQGRRDAGDDN